MLVEYNVLSLDCPDQYITQYLDGAGNLEHDRAFWACGSWKQNSDSGRRSRLRFQNFGNQMLHSAIACKRSVHVVALCK